MKTYLGNIIQQQRKELNLSQEQLATILNSTQATISKIETNKIVPKIGLLNIIAEKLGIPKNRCYILADKLELGIVRLADEVAQDLKNNNNDSGYAKLEELKLCVGDNDDIEKQFILWCEIILAAREIGQYSSFSWKDQLDILLQALSITQKDVEFVFCKFNFLSVQEIRILNTIANLYGQMGDQPKAIEIYTGLFRYMTAEHVYLEDFLDVLTLVISNCGRAMGLEGRYKESVNISEYGIKICRQYVCCNNFSTILNNMGCSLFYLGEKEQAKQYLIDAVHISRIFHTPLKTKDHLDDLQKLFGKSQRSLDLES